MSHHLAEHPEGGWSRIGPGHFRDPRGFVVEVTFTGREALYNATPEILDLLHRILHNQGKIMSELDDLQTNLTALASEVSAMGGVVNALVPGIAAGVKQIETETAKLAALATAPGGVSATAVEDAAKAIATLTTQLHASATQAQAAVDALGKSVTDAQSALNPPPAPPSPPPAP